MCAIEQCIVRFSLDSLRFSLLVSPKQISSSKNPATFLLMDLMIRFYQSTILNRWINNYVHITIAIIIGRVTHSKQYNSLYSFWIKDLINAFEMVALMILTINRFSVCFELEKLARVFNEWYIFGYSNVLNAKSSNIVMYDRLKCFS